MGLKILVPLDAAKQSKIILPHVKKIAKNNNAEIIFLRVEEEPLMLGRDEVINGDTYRQIFEERTKKATTYLKGVQKEFAKEGITAQTRMAYGPVARTIVRAAEEEGADFIAMTTNKLHEFSSTNYASVTARVLQRTELPLILIRSKKTA